MPETMKPDPIPNAAVPSDSPATATAAAPAAAPPFAFGRATPLVAADDPAPNAAPADHGVLTLAAAVAVIGGAK